MKPPPDSRIAYFVLYCFTIGLASDEDVIEAAATLEDEEIKHFKLVAKIAYDGETQMKVNAILEQF